MTPERDKLIAQVFATPKGNALLAEPWETLSRADIEASVSRERKRWAQKAPSAEERYQQERRAWADEIGWPWP